MKKAQKREALSVVRLIKEVLVEQLGIPFKNIVNDTAFSKYTGSKRPDLLISNVGYDGKNDDDFVKNLLCYVEAKDCSCKIDDSDWKDGYLQGREKAMKLGMPYFGVTNCRTTYFYNTENGLKLTLNGNLVSEFQTLDVFRVMRRKLTEAPSRTDIKIGVDSLSSVSESVFNKKLWELKEEYREIDFANNTQKIDFTIGLIALEYYEEKAEIDNTKDMSQQYWSDGKQYISENGKFDSAKANNLKTLIVSYIDRLVSEDSDFKDFSQLLLALKDLIAGNNAIVSPSQLQSIYPIIDSMKPMHGAGFDLFGAVYENFANSKEKKDFGEYFTRRHYAHVLAELLMKDEDIFREIRIIDPSCGTGGMLTECFKVLRSNYEDSGTYTAEAKSYLSLSCFYGIDIRTENISRTRLNMFLVGDGHTNMFADNSLKPEKPRGKQFLTNGQYDYVITNPPYGAGTIMAETDVLNSYRMEIAFICKIIDLLKVGGKACIITPDGVLENPSFKKLRTEIMSVCHVEAIISLPKFAFAPYTKEKTYALFVKKKHERNYNAAKVNKGKRHLATGKFQKDPIWMYIIDNDGFANSDKRFPTRLRNENQQWMHDEVSGYSDNKGNEQKSLLVQRWKNYDDRLSGGTGWMDEKGVMVKQRKGGFVPFEEINKDEYHTLLPERYLRPYEPHFVSQEEFAKEMSAAMADIKKMARIKGFIVNGNTKVRQTRYQTKDVPINTVLDYVSGNSGLTEEFLYNNIGLEGQRYKILSSATKAENQLGEIPKCKIKKQELKVFEDKEGLLVIRKGKAGKTYFLQPGKYTLNDDAYILYVKPQCPYQINLKWLSLQYRSEFLAYASSSDNGTWNMTGFFNGVKIDIPEYEEQIRLVKMYEDTEKLQEQIEAVQNRIANLCNKEIS
ncbi:MAG: SAM-dependent DNA methyltransferase [Prevotellaceae bacterium]|nr:SAM-dependent DNA methyltransferase [Prevotellaceae bacterium]